MASSYVGAGPVEGGRGGRLAPPNASSITPRTRSVSALLASKARICGVLPSAPAARRRSETRPNALPPPRPGPPISAIARFALSPGDAHKRSPIGRVFCGIISPCIGSGGLRRPRTLKPEPGPGSAGSKLSFMSNSESRGGRNSAICGLKKKGPGVSTRPSCAKKPYDSVAEGGSKRG